MYQSISSTVMMYPKNCVLALVFGLFVGPICTFASILANPSSVFTDTLSNLPLLEETGVTKELSHLNTSQLITYFGYQSETYTVTTQDGYILTLFRCKSKTVPTIANKVVILFHGLLSSSDCYTINIPNQALAYFLADAGYDVWLPNVRGNTYSRKHTTKNPDIPISGFWNFSWDTIGFYDYAAIFDFVLQKTNTSKAYMVGHSQGTSALMAFLAQRPEYNAKVAAASLMAPVSYLKHAALLFRVIDGLAPVLQGLQNTEIFARSSASDVSTLLCGLDVSGTLCERFLNLVVGPSDGQQNETMLPSMVAHEPSGASVNQILHYGDDIRLDYFGPRLSNYFATPTEFDLSKITAPISLHYSPVDAFTNPIDVNRLIPKLKNSLKNVQIIDQVVFNHIDFVWGINASTIVYPNITQFFSKY